MFSEPYSLWNRTNVFIHKTLRSNARNFIETVITVQRVESQFFCDIFVAFYIKLECLEAL